MEVCEPSLEGLEWMGLRRGSVTAGRARKSPVPICSRPRAPLMGRLLLSAVLRASQSHRVQGTIRDLPTRLVRQPSWYQVWHGVDQPCCGSGPIWAVSATSECRLGQRQRGLDQIWAALTKIRATSAKFGGVPPNLVKFRPSSPLRHKLGWFWPNLACFRPQVGRFDRNTAKLTQFNCIRSATIFRMRNACGYSCKGQRSCMCACMNNKQACNSFFSARQARLSLMGAIGLLTAENCGAEAITLSKKLTLGAHGASIFPSLSPVYIATCTSRGALFPLLSVLVYVMRRHLVPNVQHCALNCRPNEVCRGSCALCPTVVGWRRFQCAPLSRSTSSMHRALLWP